MTSSPCAASNAWSMSGTIASLAFAGGQATLDVTAAARGLELRTASGEHDALLGVDLDAVADHWLRGADVVATYEPDDSRRLRSTVMWRANGSRAGVVSWEAVVSAQTFLLETEVAVDVRSDIAADELLWSPAGGSSRWRTLPPGAALPGEAAAVLARRQASSCLVAVHPSDARRIAVNRVAGRVGITCRLFAAPLEKGVLMRSRVLTAVGTVDGDEAWAERTLQAFASSPPPLTT